MLPYPLPANPELIPCPSRDAWLIRRREGVGASEAADLVGAGDNASALRVYAEKTIDTPPIDSKRFRLGLTLERPILAAAPREFGGSWEPWPENTLARSREFPRMQCTPDGLAVMDPTDEYYRPGVGVAQVKTWSEFDRRAWDGDGPLVYQVQVQHELAVTGCQWGCLLVLIGATDLIRVVIDRNERFIAALRAAVDAFWLRVEVGDAPAPEETAKATEAINLLHPNDNGRTIALPGDSAAVIESLARAKRIGKLAERRKRACENQLRAMLGDNTFGVLPDGRAVSWKTQSREAYAAERSSYRVLRTHAKTPKGAALSVLEETAALPGA